MFRPDSAATERSDTAGKPSRAARRRTASGPAWEPRGEGSAQPVRRPVNGDELLHHLLLDLLVKGLIGLGAVVVLVIGAVVIWRRAGR